MTRILGSTFGITGHVFHAAGSSIAGVDASVVVIGITVFIARAGVGNRMRMGASCVCVGTTTWLGVTFATQADIKIHTSKMHTLFMSISISKKYNDYFMLNLRS